MLIKLFSVLLEGVLVHTSGQRPGAGSVFPGDRQLVLCGKCAVAGVS